MAIVKSNAYGHGLLEVAKTLTTYNLQLTTGVWFGVDNLEEAFQLKKCGVRDPILILGYIPRPRLAEAIKNGFRFALYDIDVLKECARIAKKLHKTALVHIKVETGTYRQGLLHADIAKFAGLLRTYSPVVKPEGVYTHFADTEDMSSQYYKEQLHLFKKSISLFKDHGITTAYQHVAASAATLLYPKTHFNMVRWGIGLYGLYPSQSVQSSALHMLRKMQLRPVMTWKTRITQVKKVSKGETIGYDRTFSARKPITIAILPVGYWDGYDRRFSNNGHVLIGGKKCPIVGIICMNMCMVDVTRMPGAYAGDEAVLLGRQGTHEISVEELAAKIGTINYEIVTRINPLIPRILV